MVDNTGLPSGRGMTGCTIFTYGRAVTARVTGIAVFGSTFVSAANMAAGTVYCRVFACKRVGSLSIMIYFTSRPVGSGMATGAIVAQ